MANICPRSQEQDANHRNGYAHRSPAIRYGDGAVLPVDFGVFKVDKADPVPNARQLGQIRLFAPKDWSDFAMASTLRNNGHHTEAVSLLPANSLDECLAKQVGIANG